MLRRICIAAALCLGALMIAPTAMATPPTDFCTIDVLPGIPIDHGVNVAPTDCVAVTPAFETIVLRMPGGDEDEAAGPVKSQERLMPFGLSRQHFDPGRVGI